MTSLAVVDTNIWVSAFITPHGYPARLIAYWQANRFDVLVSAELLAELILVLARPRLQLKYNYSNEQMLAYVRLMSELGKVVTITSGLNICRDPDDNIVLETAVVGKATHLISRDQDLARDPRVAEYLEKYQIRVLTVQRFLDELEHE